MSFWEDIEDCSTCGGNDYVTCPDCHGSGEDDDSDSNTHIRCSECDGEGAVECPESHDHCGVF